MPEAASAGVHPGFNSVGGEIQNELPESELPGRKLIARVLQQPCAQTGIAHLLPEPSQSMMIALRQDAAYNQVVIFRPVQRVCLILPKKRSHKGRPRVSMCHSATFCGRQIWFVQIRASSAIVGHNRHSAPPLIHTTHCRMSTPTPPPRATRHVSIAAVSG